MLCSSGVIIIHRVVVNYVFFGNLWWCVAVFRRLLGSLKMCVCCLAGCVQVCRHVLAVNGGGILDGTPMARADSAFDMAEVNYRYWQDYDDGVLDHLLLPLTPGPLTRCLLTFGPFASAASTPTLRTAHGDSDGRNGDGGGGGGGGGGGRPRRRCSCGTRHH